MSRLNTLVQSDHEDLCDYLGNHGQYQAVDDAIPCAIRKGCHECPSAIRFTKLEETLNEQTH